MARIFVRPPRGVSCTKSKEELEAWAKEHIPSFEEIVFPRYRMESFFVVTKDASPDAAITAITSKNAFGEEFTFEAQQSVARLFIRPVPQDNDAALAVIKRELPEGVQIIESSLRVVPAESPFAFIQVVSDETYPALQQRAADKEKEVLVQFAHPRRRGQEGDAKVHGRRPSPKADAAPMQAE